MAVPAYAPLPANRGRPDRMVDAVNEIAVIAPVLSRPQNAWPLADSLLTSTDRANLLFVVSPDDSEQELACAKVMHDHEHGKRVRVRVIVEPTGPGDYALKIQRGYDATTEPLVLLGADDLRFHPGWAEAVLALADEYDCGVIGTQDLANPQVKAGHHSTHPVVRRCYIDQLGGVVGEPGVVYHAGYDHQFCDTELVETAKARGCYLHCHAAVVEHRHPLYDRTVATDATYTKGQAHGREDSALYESRRHLWLNEAALV